MQHLILTKGARLADVLRALAPRIADVPEVDRDTPAVLAASGPVLSIVTTQPPAPISVQLAPGQYVISGRLVDTRAWPEAARTLDLPGINDDALPAPLMLSATWRQRFWPAGEPAFDAGAAPLDQTGPKALPLDASTCVSEEPILHITLRKDAAQHDALCLGQIVMADQGDLRLDDAVMPFGADISRAPALRQALLDWLQPLFTRVDAMDATRLTADCTLSGATSFNVNKASEWAEITRLSLGLAGAVDVPTVLREVRASVDRFMTKIGAKQLPHVDEGSDGFDLRTWLPTDPIVQALDTVSDAVAAEMVPQTAGLVLPSSHAKASYSDGTITIHAALGKSLDQALGLTERASAIRISVEPAQPDLALYATGTALLHPHAQANRLPAALGRIPLASTASGGLSLHVSLTNTGFDNDIAEVLSADALRLVLAADPDGDVDHRVLPLTLTLTPE